MRFLADVPVSPKTVAWLNASGHDAIHAVEAGLATAKGEAILAFARRENRIVLTTDLGFGMLLALSGADRPGVIIFRVRRVDSRNVNRLLLQVFRQVSEAKLHESIVLVEEERIRIRPLPISRSSNPARLSHIDESGRARMVDVGGKPDTERVAVAKGEIAMRPETLALIQEGGIPKGDVLAVAQVAGIMAAKRTHELIPMCHPLLLTHVAVEFAPNEPESCIEITATVRTTGKTGVEMEALTAVVVAALTIYDMCKAVDRAMRIQNVRLVRKRGGKSGEIVLEKS